MKIYKPIRVAGLLVVGLFGFAQASHAVGTSANTTISNQTSLSYTVGVSPAITVDSDVVSFVVDNSVNVLVTEVGGALTTVSPGQTNAVITFNVANLGNADQGYTFVAAGNIANDQTLFGGTDAFDVTITGIMVDTNDNGMADDTLVSAATTNLLSLAQNADVDVFVFATIPLTATDGQAGLVSLTAITNDDGTTNVTANDDAIADDPDTVQVVFIDAAGTDDAANSGTHSARDGYIVQSAQISLAKSVTTIRDDVNLNVNPKAIPGAYVQYSITIQNDDSAGADAILTTITDTLDTNLGFDPDHVDGATGNPQGTSGAGIRVQTGTFGCTGGNGANPRNIDTFFTTAADLDGASHDGSATGGTVSVALQTVLPAGANHAAGELEPCENVTITFNAVIQ